MKRAFNIVAFMLPLLVVSASFAPDAHHGASFYANGPMPTSYGYLCPAVWEPSALISSLAKTDEERRSYYFDKGAFPSIHSNYRTSTQGIIRGLFTYPTYLVGSGHSGVKSHYIPVSIVAKPIVYSLVYEN